MRFFSESHKDLLSLNINLVSLMIETQNLRNRILRRGSLRPLPNPKKNVFHDFLAKTKVLVVR